MSGCNDCSDVQTIERSCPPSSHKTVIAQRHKDCLLRACPSCGHHIKYRDQGGIHDLPGLPAGVKFDPTDQELLEHLEGKVRSDAQYLKSKQRWSGSPFLSPAFQGIHDRDKETKEGPQRHRRLRDPVAQNRQDKPVFIGGREKGYKKILVLYTNYGKQKKLEKTNWVMHQYHLGNNEEEKDGELVVSKVFYQTQPRQCSSIKDSLKAQSRHDGSHHLKNNSNNALVQFYNPKPSFISFDQGGQSRSNRSQLLPHFAVHGGS